MLMRKPAGYSQKDKRAPALSVFYNHYSPAGGLHLCPRRNVGISALLQLKAKTKHEEGISEPRLILIFTLRFHKT